MDGEGWRKSRRLPGYDYRHPGAYFVTICLLDRLHLLGEISNGTMHASPAGHMVRAVWDAIPERYNGIQIDEFVAMPDHVHGIVMLTGTTDRSSPSLPQVVQRFKSLTTARYREAVASSNWPPYRGALWQRNYYERVIRHDAELNRVRQYIRDNPARWTLEREHPENLW